MPAEVPLEAEIEPPEVLSHDQFAGEGPSKGEAHRKLDSAGMIYDQFQATLRGL